VQAIKDWVDELRKAARIAVSEGHFRADVDPEQFAFEEYGVMLGTQTFLRFIGDPAALDRARQAFERLVSTSRAASPRAATR
jgi:hypothetical protein